ncbi:SDR family NAD(P)-dependent oxidoreductase [Alcaligenes faecalis]|uniref:SDR family oxidoreductase n=1 Tax=Alcaligenes faecalis TaxID=511 RepID=UPI001293DFA8|nr:SDR family oxidoreductase [Alcaligenes faecalis]MBX6964303.1 SDR family oxidoreductase [Providencia rettgeri]MBX7032389.1 SDR family oxidoreductase [Alcaligenes faecalis]QFY76718.1 SDR family NAD(P)-dependent oxidoreductase [Alcaligenes faecalis]
MKTVLITGCSSGFGLETTSYFLQQGWKVIATMRTPRPDLLPVSEHLRVLPLDITDPSSIQHLIEQVGPIDVLVNNAGIGALNALEGTSMKVVRETFETNTFGTLAMMQAVLPQFRARKAGIIINISSSVTLTALPLIAAYTASKVALNALSESLAQELKPFNVRVHLILPGRSPQTRFGENSRSRMEAIPQAYSELAQQVFQEWAQSSAPMTEVSDVVAAIWRAATDAHCPAYLAAGADAQVLVEQAAERIALARAL